MNNQAYEKLYKVARKHHFDIQKQFENEQLSDEQYFILGLSDDIMSNIINVLINLKIDNYESIGIDNSCRAIIEAICLLNMYKQGKIDDHQVKIYRYQYALVDKENLGKIIKMAGLGKELFDRRINEDKETAYSLLAEAFNTTKKELKNSNLFLGDPLTFLKHNPKDPISLSSIVRDYNPYDERFLHLYTFFSIFDHPRYEHNLDYEQKIQKIRLKIIDLLFVYIVEYLAANKLFLKDDSQINSIDQDLDQEDLKDLDSNIATINIIFDELSKKLGEYKNGTDNFTLFFLSKAKAIAINMLVTVSLGYNEQTVAVFRPFMELVGTFNFINNSKDREEMIYLKKAFWCSSAIQFDLCMEKMGVKLPKTNCNPVLKEIYDNYYKEKYSLNSFVEFKKKIISNSLYFYSNETAKSYRRLIKESTESLLKENKLAVEDYLTAYKVAVDVSHAGGYSFNATPIIIETYALRSIVLFWQYILTFTLYATYTANTVAHKNVDASKLIFLIREFIRYYDEQSLKLDD